MHFGQKDTEDDSVRITIFWQVRPLHLKGVSFFTNSFPSSFISFSLVSTFESEEDKDEAGDADVFSPAASPLSFTTFADDDAEEKATVEVARFEDVAEGMGGKSSSSPPAFFAVVVDFADADDILMVFFLVQ